MAKREIEPQTKRELDRLLDKIDTMLANGTVSFQVRVLKVINSMLDIFLDF